MTNEPNQHSKSRLKQAAGIPKGFYRLPEGRITRDPSPGGESTNRLRIRIVRRDPIDIEGIANALIELARSENEPDSGIRNKNLRQ